MVPQPRIIQTPARIPSPGDGYNSGDNYPMHPRFTSVVAPLPSTVPFVGPEAQDRPRGAAFKARIGANESVFGPSLKAIAAMRQDAA
jgi:hypothetical protein